LAAVAAVRILGIDPGTHVVGFGLLELRLAGQRPAAAGVPLALRVANAVRADAHADLAFADCGVLRLGGRKQSLHARLLRLSDLFRDLLLRLRPDELALEEAFYGKSVPAALRIGEARGVVLAEAARHGLDVHQYAPARIKRCVTGNGSAGKATVAAMVLQQVAGGGAVAAVAADATDALAAALTRAEERRSPLLRAAAACDGDAERPAGAAALHFGRQRPENASDG
jgi:crossover junction endodeoxyribonuclease RuvC